MIWTVFRQRWRKYTGQEHYKEQERTSYDEELDIAGTNKGEPESKTEPVGIYQQEMRKFFDNCVAEGKEYDSNAEAYEAFKNYYDKRMKAQGQAGKQMFRTKADVDKTMKR